MCSGDLLIFTWWLWLQRRPALVPLSIPEALLETSAKSAPLQPYSTAGTFVVPSFHGDSVDSEFSQAKWDGLHKGPWIHCLHSHICLPFNSHPSTRHRQQHSPMCSTAEIRAKLTLTVLELISHSIQALLSDSTIKKFPMIYLITWRDQIQYDNYLFTNARVLLMKQNPLERRSSQYFLSHYSRYFILWLQLFPLHWYQKRLRGASLVARWLGVCLLMQGTRVRALVWGDPECRGAAGPVSHNCWACASGACAPRRGGPRWRGARAPRWRAVPAPRWRVAPACRNWRKPSREPKTQHSQK